MFLRSRACRLSACLCVWLAACTSRPDVREAVPAPTPPSRPVLRKPLTFDRTTDYNARLIAGLDVPELGAYAALRRSPGWRQYASDLDSSWEKVEKQRFAPMRRWAALHLADTAAQVLYPFSGPDFVHAHAFFPHAASYYLFGLEPIGALPDVRKQDPAETVRYCHAVRATLRDVFRRSYFLTKRMSADLPRINGVVPLICVFLVRTGHVITHVKPLVLMDNGQVMEWKGAQKALPGERPRMVRIDCLHQATGKSRSVFYYAGDLSDAAIRARPALRKYLQNLPAGSTGYLKSASYLLHYDAFSMVRNTLLAKCATLLQDDTGIAYRHLEAPWRIQLYGTYRPPIAEFAGRFQPDLDRAYRDTARVRPLPFDLGYHWGTHHDNLIRATRR